MLQRRGAAMAEFEERGAKRDEAFLMADLRLENDARAYRVQLRNLSTHGMMGVGNVDVVRGTRLLVDFRKAGEAWGTVAWREGNRFGIAFDNAIDTDKVRAALDDGTGRQSET